MTETKQAKIASSNSDDSTNVTPTESLAVRITPVPRITLQMFASTNAQRVDSRGDVRDAHELMGAFVYHQKLLGRLADTEENFRTLWAQFCES